MTSIKMRNDRKFLRDEFPCEGEFEIPIIRHEELPLSPIDLVACSRTRKDDTDENRRKGVHFFVDDYRFDVFRRHPERDLDRSGRPVLHYHVYSQPGFKHGKAHRLSDRNYRRYKRFIEGKLDK